jgi:tetratricopeptide (TPR) repeat protein
MIRSTELAERLALAEQGYRPLAFLAEAGFLFCQRGRERDALAIFDALVHLAPNDPVPWLGRSEALARLREFDDARRAAIEARRRRHAALETLIYSYAIECQLLVEARDLDEARCAFEALRALDPEHAYVAELDELLATAALAESAP